MSREDLGLLYREYFEEARTLFRETITTPRSTLPNARLSKTQQNRFESWQDILATIGCDRRQPTPEYVEDLANYLGLGVWRVDHCREVIKYEDLTSPIELSFDGDTFDRELKHLISIPFGRGTIGYAVDHIRRFEHKYYLVSDSLGELRGAVAVEDRILGHINVLLCPIFASDERSSRGLRLFLSAFLPVPNVLTRAFAREFVRQMHSFGERILLRWERQDLAMIIDAVSAGVGQASTESVLPPLPVQQSPDAADHNFPWVAVAKLPPVANPHHDRHQTASELERDIEGEILKVAKSISYDPDSSAKSLSHLSRVRISGDPFLTSLMEPGPYVRSRNLGNMGQMIRRAWTQQYLLDDCLKTDIRFVERKSQDDSPDERPILDLVLPVFVPERPRDQLMGLLRVHLSLPLIRQKHDTLTITCDRLPAEMEQFLERLRSDTHLTSTLSRLGQVLAGMRTKTRRHPVAVKLERELEHLLFKTVFRFLQPVWTTGRKRGCRPSLPRSLNTRTIEAAVKDAIEFTPSEVTEATEVLETLYLHLRDILLEPSITDFVLGYSYWSIGTEVTLDAKINSKADRFVCTHRRFARDMQRVVSFIATNASRSPSPVPATETLVISPKTEMANQDRYGDGEAHIVGTDSSEQKNEFFDNLLFHLETPDSPRRAVRSIELTRTTKSSIRTRLFDDETCCMWGAKWRLEHSWPRVRAYHIVGEQPAERRIRRLERHLSAQRSQFVSVNSEKLAQWEYENDPLHGTPAAEEMCECRHGTSPRARSLRDFLESVAPNEIADLEQIWAIPFQVFNHVYYWVFVGARSHLPVDETGHLQRDEKNSDVIALIATETRLRRVAGLVEQRLTREVYANVYERLDVNHRIKDPAGTIWQTLEESIKRGERLPKTKMKTLSHEAYRLNLRCRLLTGLQEGVDSFSNLTELLDSAHTHATEKIENDPEFRSVVAKNPPWADTHHKIRDTLKDRIARCRSARTLSIEPWRRDDKILLHLLLTDLLSNAMQHCDPAGLPSVQLSRSQVSDAGDIPYEQIVLTISNPITAQKRKVLVKARDQGAPPGPIDILNRVLALDFAGGHEFDLESLGLGSAWCWASRLRIGLRAEVTSSRRFKISVYLTPLCRSVPRVA